MLSQEEETRIRQTVRRSLDSILGAGPATLPSAESAANEAEMQRIEEAERVIADETERYYQSIGRVRHVSHSGQVFWVTGREKAKLEQRRSRRQRDGILSRLTSRVFLVWAVTLLFATLLVGYLIRTVSIAGLTD